MTPESHAACCHSLARAVPALRLNRAFPPRDVVATWLDALAEHPSPWDPAAGLPHGPAWLALDAARASADPARWDLDIAALPEGERARVVARRSEARRLVALPPLPRRDVAVRLRHRGADLASYEVVVDRFDPVSTTLARYTLHLDDVPGARLSDGELELSARDHFDRALSLLDEQDAPLAFAVLADAVHRVTSVTRGVIGPARPERGIGPRVLDDVCDGPVLSACLERASIDLDSGVVDDPLAGQAVLPGKGQAFGTSRMRKWAARDARALRTWLARVGSRNLVYEVPDGP